MTYFEDKVKGVEPAGQEKSGAPAANAELQRKQNGRWVVAWKAPLTNDVAPVDAIIRNDGAYFVTFDDWHSLGHGPNAVVIYGSEGERIARLALVDIVPANYIEVLPHSVSSIHWRGDPRFSRDGKHVVIPVPIPSEKFSTPRTVDLAISLADGSVSPLDSAAWKKAVEATSLVRTARMAEARAVREAFFAPLLGPRENTQRHWHIYLREAVARLIGDGNTPSTTVLRSPGEPDYAVSESWIREALLEPTGDKVALATLSESNLARTLAKIAPKITPDSLSQTTIFVAVSDKYWSDIVAAMRPTGAKLVQLNPSIPLEQRQERIERRYGSSAAGLLQSDQGVLGHPAGSVALLAGVLCIFLAGFWMACRRYRRPS
ncbi:hypothetical protein [Altericroceibacterium endophyticum]|nr:hypothetical protein [Altericroceibacterium endophyticum]